LDPDLLERQEVRAAAVRDAGGAFEEAQCGTGRSVWRGDWV
jgi:hypothetical protein